MYYVYNQEIKTVNVTFKRKEGKEKERERDGAIEGGRKVGRKGREEKSEEKGREQKDDWDMPAITLQ